MLPIESMPIAMRASSDITMTVDIRANPRLFFGIFLTSFINGFLDFVYIQCNLFELSKVKSNYLISPFVFNIMS